MESKILHPAPQDSFCLGNSLRYSVHSNSLVRKDKGKSQKCRMLVYPVSVERWDTCCSVVAAGMRKVEQSTFVGEDKGWTEVQDKVSVAQDLPVRDTGLVEDDSVV